MRKSSGLKSKLDQFSYQATSKGGSVPILLKSLRELNNSLAKLDKKKKK